VPRITYISKFALFTPCFRINAVLVFHNISSGKEKGYNPNLTGAILRPFVIMKPIRLCSENDRLAAGREKEVIADLFLYLPYLLNI
jgi:hypothetical protein